jgi:prepilin-type N-terminal cleavage/methylation domain-containing protein
VAIRNGGDVRRKTGEKGFTATELMIALTIVGILAALALPAYFTFVQSTRAAQAVADLQAIRAAVYLYYGDMGQWPRESAAGVVPLGVQHNLPRNFTFRKNGYTLDYDNWLPLHRRGRVPAGTTTAIGVSIVSRDRKFLERVDGLIRDAKFNRVSNTKYILEIATLDGF